MKKKIKFNKIKVIRNWTIILVAIVISFILFFTRKENETAKEEIIETFSANLTSNVITVEIEDSETKNKIKDWKLILVNKDNQLPEDYQFELQTIEDTHKVDARIVEPLAQMLADARKQGLQPVICSAYRTTDTQTTLFNQKLNQYKRLGYIGQEAEEKASYWVTPPRTSEHEIGLAVDIVSKNYQVLNEKQEDTAVQKWLMEHCSDYGFVLRYPTHKKEITKINYEPWHYRYVGVENAKLIEEKGFCLEEYIEELKN